MNHPTKHITILVLLLILALVGCIQHNAALPPSPTVLTSTITQTAIATPDPLSTSLPTELRALVKNSIEFYREGKTYEVVIGYNVGSVLLYVTPEPALPEKYTELLNGSPRLIGYGDFDQDGETEFYVTVIYCGANCGEELRLYKYDPAQDQFIIADQISSRKFRLQEYKDLNQDGNPELIVKGPGYCLYGDAGEKVFAVVTVLQYEQGKIRDVTKEFPSLIVEDAKHFLSFSKTDGDHQGVAELTLASYLYDMYRLGKLDEARPNFDQVCNEVVKPRREKQGENFDCLTFRTEVEADIQKYEQSKSHK